MAFIKNIDSDYGAVGDGETNDRAAFLAFRDAAAAQSEPAILTLTSDSIYFMGARDNPTNADEDYIFSGIYDLTVTTSSSGQAKFTDTNILDEGGENYHLGCRHGYYNDSATDCRIETVSAGASSVILQTDSDHTSFAVGDWLLIAGFHMQDAGFPINPHFFEFAKVASKQTAVSPYSITFETPLRNGYKSTWPDWSSVTYGFTPAGLHRFDQVWDCQHEYQNLIIEKLIPGPFGAEPWRNGTNCGGRSITLRNVTPTNFDGINPSGHISHTIIDSDYTAVTMELDKTIETITIDNCSMGGIGVQSSSVDLMHIINGTTFTQYLIGTPKRLVVEDSMLYRLIPGPYAYGSCEEITLTNSVITDGIVDGGLVYKGGNPYIGQDLGVNNGLNTMTDGVIAISKTYGGNSTNWAIPRSRCSWTDANRWSIKMFNILDVTDDDDFVYVHTDETGSWPDYDTNGHLWIRTHPCPSITVTGCSVTAPAGTNDGSYLYHLGSAPAGDPLYSYMKFIGDGKAGTEGQGGYLWGNLIEAHFNVTVATAAAKDYQPTGGLGYNWLTEPDGSLITYPGYVPIIDFHAVADRTITIVDGEYDYQNFQGGDSGYLLTSPEVWWANHFTSTTVGGVLGSGSQSITVTMKADQGPFLASEVPLHTFTCSFS